MAPALTQGRGHGGSRGGVGEGWLLPPGWILAPAALGSPCPALSPVSVPAGSALVQHGHAVLRPWGQPRPPALKPPAPFGLSPLFAPSSGAATARGECQGGHGRCGASLDGPHEPLPTSSPLSRSVSLRGAVGSPGQRLPRTETARRRTQLGAGAASPVCLVVGMRPVSGAFAWDTHPAPPRTPGSGDTWQQQHARPGHGRAGGRMAACSSFQHPWLSPWHCGGLRAQELRFFTCN